jgi:hypothetical protein
LERQYLYFREDITAMLAKKSIYSGALEYFQLEGINKVYMISMGSPQTIFQTDAFSETFQVVIDKIEGQLKRRYLYLYEISSINQDLKMNIAAKPWKRKIT